MSINEEKSHQGLLLVVLFGVAFILRIPTISSPLARDEAVTFNHYAHLDILEILFNYPDSNQHALFSILSNICLLIFGDHEVVFRLPSLVMGVLAIPLAYYAFLSLKFPQTTSFTSSLLLALYVSHITYSQEGRGYTLTVFLAICLILSSIKILENRRLWLWGGLLVASATCIVITLPSNAIFVAGAAGFCWVLRAFRKLENPGEQQNNSYCYLKCYVLSFFLITAYLLINLADLQLSAEANSRGNIQWENLWQIADFLISPWGFWFYLFFIVGFFSSLKKQIRYGFLALFLIPVVLTLVTGIVGFARIYIYFAPFVFLFVSIGFVFLYEKIKVINKNLMYAFLVSSFLWVFYQPFLVLTNYYPDRLKAGNVYIKDAIQLREFVENQPLNLLPVIMNAGVGRSVLNHYLGENLSKRMKLFVAGKNIEKIIFLCKTGIPPNKYKLHQVFNDVEVVIPKNSIKLIKSFDHSQVFEWDVELSRMPAGQINLDYENQVAGINDSFNTYAIENPRGVGHTSLLIDNLDAPSTSPTIFIVFPQIFNVELDRREGFVLNIFLKAPKHKTLFRTMMVNKDASKIPSAYLNSYLDPDHSEFYSKVSEKKWEMVVLLSSIGTGKRVLREIIETAEKKTLIDGVQSYMVKSID